MDIKNNLLFSLGNGEKVYRFYSHESIQQPYIIIQIFNRYYSNDENLGRFNKKCLQISK